jgi:hypothetical protein
LHLLHEKHQTSKVAWKAHQRAKYRLPWYSGLPARKRPHKLQGWETANGGQMFRLKVFLLLTVVPSLPFLLAACASTPPAWAYYDKCSAQTSGFVAMAECGKEARNAECIPRNNCSSVGTAFVQYTDALVLSVKNKEMTEAEAMRHFAEYKTNVLGDIRRDRAIVAAGAAASGPTSCTKIGNTVNCY